MLKRKRVNSAGCMLLQLTSRSSGLLRYGGTVTALWLEAAHIAEPAGSGERQSTSDTLLRCYWQGCRCMDAC